ncbi:hypothetical protein [Salmonirosea aquatica]|uniref:Tetratricopeptide repeat protein n=1 Tax=Salmonirosea aquatica TaxID=2654236 RepID=A0A7C9FT76_9BACT|nr:hypothetical protein [Cytophagaceae bacterium SJW1-29]
MTYFLLNLLLWIWDNRSFDAISQANRHKTEAETAFLNKDFRQAAHLYEQITNGSLFAEPASRLYLAHSYFYLDSLDKARSQYKLLVNVQDDEVASKANTQLAVLSTMRDRDTLEALNYLKVALRQSPDNRKARYNYELLKKTFSGRASSPDTPPVEQPAPTPAPPVAPSAQRELELAQEREEMLQNLRRLHMSEDQARSILDAMKTNEAQYIYQLRRRQYYDQSERSKIIEW